MCVNKGHLDSSWQLNSTLTKLQKRLPRENGLSQQVVARFSLSLSLSLSLSPCTASLLSFYFFRGSANNRRGRNLDYVYTTFCNGKRFSSPNPKWARAKCWFIVTRKKKEAAPAVCNDTNEIFSRFICHWKYARSNERKWHDKIIRRRETN